MDDCSRELVGQYIGFSIGSQQVIRLLEQLIAEHSCPQSIACDNGPEFTSKKMHLWSQDSRVKLHFIQPGKPTQHEHPHSSLDYMTPVAYATRAV